MTFLAARRCDQLTAPCVFDGPINGEGFRAYVNQQPVPTLEPDDIVIMDNPGGHKSKAVREAIKHAGARLWFLLRHQCLVALLTIPSVSSRNAALYSGVLVNVLSLVRSKPLVRCSSSSPVQQSGRRTWM